MTWALISTCKSCSIDHINYKDIYVFMIIVFTFEHIQKNIKKTENWRERNSDHSKLQCLCFTSKVPIKTNYFIHCIEACSIEWNTLCTWSTIQKNTSSFEQLRLCIHVYAIAHIAQYNSSIPVILIDRSYLYRLNVNEKKRTTKIITSLKAFERLLDASLIPRQFIYLFWMYGKNNIDWMQYFFSPFLFCKI